MPTDDAAAWMNGRIVPFSEMRLPVWDLGVVAGASITEMARTYHHRPFRIEQHLQRLMDSCQELQIEMPYRASELLEAAESVVAHNVTQLTATSDLGIVVFVTAGGNATYLGGGDVPGPTVGIHTFPLPFAMWKKSVTDGVNLSIPERRQHSESDLPVQFKIRNRLHWWLADRDAARAQPGSRALLLDADGHLTETSTACFFAVIDGTIITPRRNVLRSMSRRMVAECAAAAGIPFAEADLTVRDLPSVQEAFVSSTPVGIFQVASINGNSIECSSPPVVDRLLNEWTKIAGRNPAEQICQA